MVYEYNNHKDDRLIIQEAEHHIACLMKMKKYLRKNCENEMHQ